MHGATIRIVNINIDLKNNLTFRVCLFTVTYSTYDKIINFLLIVYWCPTKFSEKSDKPQLY